MEKDVRVELKEKVLQEEKEGAMIRLKPYRFSILSALIGIILLIISINGVEIANFLFTSPLPGAGFLLTNTYIPSVLGLACILLAISTCTVQYAHQLKKGDN
ncbi:hypothetical protein [Rossellomorea marisflavi]|uniref:hypothetical protein n=2 Tax=Rossellomorea TaxID=2837508 RepID=UPI00064F3E03|nr:hypothetical protein [Rossellomorea marisflavi]KML08271.1 hypothetical protein VL06_02080 [Rossellomorea marisflavi]